MVPSLVVANQKLSQIQLRDLAKRLPTVTDLELETMAGVVVKALENEAVRNARLLYERGMLITAEHTRRLPKLSKLLSPLVPGERSRLRDRYTKLQDSKVWDLIALPTRNY